LKDEVYVETTIVSYLAARLSRDLIVAAHQQLTEDWWLQRRPSFDLFTSRRVAGYEPPTICTPEELMGE